VCFFFVVVVGVSSSFERRDRDILHDRDAPDEDRHYIVIRFLSVVIVARVENTQKQLKGGFIYTLLY